MDISLSGHSYNANNLWGNNGESDAIIVKHSLDGASIITSQNFGGIKEDAYESVIATKGGFVVVGYSYGKSNLWGNNGEGDAIILKYSKLHEEQKQVEEPKLGVVNYIGFASIIAFISLGGIVALKKYNER